MEKNYTTISTVAQKQLNKTRAHWPRAACSVLAALGLAVALSGCIIAPWHPEHPHYHGY